MNHCEEFQALLDPFVDGELAPDAMARVREHLDACPACRDYVDSALAIRAAFPSVEDTEVPEDFAEGVMARVRANANPPGRTVAVNFRRRWMGVAAALAACCAIVVLLRTGPAGMGGGMDSGAPVTANDAAPQIEAAYDTAADQSDKNEDELADEAGMDADGPVDMPAEEPAEKDEAATSYKEDKTETSYTAGALPESAAEPEEGNSSARMLEIAPQSGDIPIGDTEDAGAGFEDFAGTSFVESASETAAIAGDSAPVEAAGGASENCEEPETPVMSYAPAPEPVPAPAAASSKSEEPDLVLSSDEAGNLLDAFVPAEDRGTERVYLLTREEFAALLEKLPLSVKPEPAGDKETWTVVVTAA